MVILLPALVRTILPRLVSRTLNRPIQHSPFEHHGCFRNVDRAMAGLSFGEPCPSKGEHSIRPIPSTRYNPTFRFHIGDARCPWLDRTAIHKHQAMTQYRSSTQVFPRVGWKIATSQDDVTSTLGWLLARFLRQSREECVEKSRANNQIKAGCIP